MNGRILAIAAVAGGLSLAAPAAYGHVTNAAAGADGANAAISSSASVQKVQYRRARRAYGVRRYYGRYGGRRVWVYPSYVWNGGPYLYYSTSPVAAAPVVVPAPVVAAPVVAAPAPVIAAPVVAPAPVVAAPTYYQPVVAPTLLPVTPF